MTRPIPQKGDPDYTDYVIQLAKGMVRKGVINEPRVLFDEVTQTDTAGLMAAGTPGVFVNGEQFPLRLTRMAACVRYTDVAGNVDVETNIQRIGARLKFHDQFYMNSDFLPLPVWGNQVVAGASSYSAGVSAWDFIKNGQPFVLSARDTLVVTLELQTAPATDETVPVNVVFTGIGALSKRPYLFNSQTDLANINTTDMSTVAFRNDGTEPVIITDMTVNVGNDSGNATPIGAIGRVRVNVRQVGNGTNAQWFSGPVVAPSIDNIQATLLGLTTGRAVVHQFPGDGFIWEPGEGLTLETMAINAPSGFDSVLCIALAGYLMVV